MSKVVDDQAEWAAPVPPALRELLDGQVFEAAYPFVRDTYNRLDADEEGFSTTEVPTWRPGTRNEHVPPDDCEAVADALGKIVLTVVSVHKPGRFPVRVFFTRTWVDPGGKAFGKTKCRVTTVPAFRRLTHGYQHQFVLLGCDCDGCDWPHSDHRLKGHTQADRELV